MTSSLLAAETITAIRYGYGTSKSRVEILLPGRTEPVALGGQRSDRAEAAVVSWDEARGEWFIQGLRAKMDSAQSEARRWTEGRVQVPGARRGIFCTALPSFAIEVLDK